MVIFIMCKCCIVNGVQEKESIKRVRMEKNGLEKPCPSIIACQHSASLLMSNSDPRDYFFHPTVTLMIDSYTINRGSYISAHVLLNFLNELGKRDKMRGLSSILSLFCNELNKFNNTRAQMLDSIYHMKLRLL